MICHCALFVANYLGAAEHPLVGRVPHRDIRELVISLGKTGLLALYRFVPHRSEVRVLGIRDQRELDFLP
jgi:hypothetical protein